MRRPAVLLVLLLWQPPAGAGEILSGNVTYRSGEYTLAVDGIVDAPFDKVYGIVTDYDNLELISPAFTDTEVLATSPSGVRRRMVTKACILFFCFDAKVVEDVREIRPGVIETAMIPAQSDFHSGTSSWEVTDRGDGRTRIRFESRIEPAFWIPPLIGPWIMKKRMLRHALKTYDRIEAIAADG